MASSFVNMSQSRRRPKRQRTPTTIYTDDNPTTFTTKKKKGQSNGQHDILHDDDGSRRSSSTGSADSRSWSDNMPDESTTSMPPPAPVVKRGRGRPPSQRKSSSVEKTLSGEKKRSSAGTFVSTKSAAGNPDSSLMSSTTTSTPKESQTAPAGAQAAPVAVVTKRKRGRPPKNKPKEIPAPSPTKVESNPYRKTYTTTKSRGEAKGIAAVNESSTNDMQDNDLVVDDTNSEGTNRRRSLPESSSELQEKESGRSRRSLGSLLTTKKDLKCPVIIKSSDNVGPTRIPNVKRRSKSGGSSKSRFRARPKSSTRWTSPNQDIEGSFVNHSVTVAPILPPVLIRDNDDENIASKTNDDRRENLSHDDGTSHTASEKSSAVVSRELQAKYPVLFDKGVPKASSCIAPPFASVGQISSGASSASSSKHKSNQSQHQLSQLPTWSPLYDPPVFFEEDYDLETGNLDIENTIPVVRHITAMTVRKPDHDYLVLGDSVGFVTIYSISKDNITLPVAQLESTACQQRAKSEQERLRADLLKRKKQTKGRGGTGSNKPSSLISNSSRPGIHNQTNNPFALGPPHGRSIVIDTSDTTINALGMIKNRVVLATSEELECMDVPSGTSLWVCPLSSNRFVTSLDMHLNTYNVLVSCSKTTDSSEAVAAPVSPLMLLQHSEDNVEICDANSPMLVRSPSCTAIWDIGASNRLLFIALSANRQEHELVLVSGGSIDSWKVACKTKIPTKASSSLAAATKLSQSPGGMYTLVASSRGIRLYQTESLQLIHVYGDQLALHGQSVMWKDCWLAGSFFSEKNKNVSRAARGLPSQWLQCDDWVEEKIRESIKGSESGKAKDKDGKDENTLAPYIIGVPHTKGPKELCENLHIWKVEHPSVVPIMSIPLPQKSEGALGLVGSGSKSRKNNSTVTQDRIVLVTNDGRGHLLSPKMESNFAGISYPPGYQVVTDNIEYVEDEEATDHANPHDAGGKNDSDDEADDADILGEGEDDDESMDEQLREAMRQSLLEHNKNGRSLNMMECDEEVDILGIDDEEDNEFLPCRPEPYLRQMVNAVVDVEESFENESKEENGAKDDVATNDKKSNQDVTDETESSKNVATKPKLTDALFISNLLEIMPNMPKIKPLEEDCLSFTTTKVVVAVNPVTQKRGRKSRAANLETLLKASINPHLQSMMLSKQGVPVNGTGSKLRAPTQNLSTSRNRVKSLSGSFSEATEAKHDAGANGDSCDSSFSGLNTKPSSSPRQSANNDEAAVVMGLLGLSPCHTPNVQGNTFVSSDSKDAQNGASASTNGHRKGSAYLNSSTLSMLGVKNDDNQVVSALSSERGSAVDGSENLAENAVDKSKLDIVDKSCSACRGRLVIHTCGKRSLPIDYESIARAERERKEKEEEEKKRLRAEKRRLADQKRREAKKQKERELQEQRLREEKERLEAEQRRRLQEDFAAQDLNENRRQQIVASYTNHLYQTQATNQLHSVEHSRSQNVEVPLSTYSNDTHHQYSQTQTNSNRLAQEARVVHQHVSNGQATTSGYSMSSKSPLAQATSPFADALAALANLADHKEALPETESRVQGTSSNGLVHNAPSNGAPMNTGGATVNEYNAPAYGASHGFGVQSNGNDTVSSGIPSYASIRGNGSPNAVASTVTPSYSLYDGYSHQGNESKMFSWPAPSNDRG